MIKSINMKIVYVLTICIMVIAFTGCKEKQVIVSYEGITEVSRTVNYDKEAIKSQAMEFIYGNINNEIVNFRSEDVMANPIINNEYYYFNTVYLQIQNYMYRFQLDADYNIVSYIKYRLEA